MVHMWMSKLVGSCLSACLMPKEESAGATRMELAASRVFGQALAVLVMPAERHTILASALEDWQRQGPRGYLRARRAESGPGFQAVGAGLQQGRAA